MGTYFTKIMEDRIILFKLFLIKRNIYEKFIKAFKYAHADSNFENYLLTHEKEEYSNLVLNAFTWEEVNTEFKDAYYDWYKVDREWYVKSKLINTLLKK